MKSFFNKSKVKNIEVYYYFKEILNPQLNNIYIYEEIINKIKNDEFLNNHLKLLGVNQYQNDYLINKFIFKIKFNLQIPYLLFEISYYNKETFIHFKNK